MEDINKTTSPGQSTFKWKKDSPLNYYQNHDFSNVGIIDDLEGQGKHQLEIDESVLAVLDKSLPGRQRVHIRPPFFENLPKNLAERRFHGVNEEIPVYADEGCEGPPCENNKEVECGSVNGPTLSMDSSAQGTNRSNNGNHGDSCPYSLLNNSNYGVNICQTSGATSVSQPMTPTLSQQNYHNAGINYSDATLNYPQQNPMYKNSMRSPPSQSQNSISWGSMPNQQTFMRSDQSSMMQHGLMNNSLGNQNYPSNTTDGYYNMRAGGSGHSRCCLHSGYANNQRRPSSQNEVMH